MAAASNPPTPYYASFLKLLVETVRCNIGECITSAYRTLSLPEAGKMLMLKDNKVHDVKFDLLNVSVYAVVVV